MKAPKFKAEIIMLCVLVLMGSKVFPQNEKVISRFIVTKATVLKGYDNSKDMVEKKTVLEFYTNNATDDICFSATVGEVKSFGGATNIIKKTIDKSATIDRADVFMFKWLYQSDNGNPEVTQSYVQLVKTYKIKSTTFWCKMVSEGREVILEGYMQPQRNKP